MDLFEKMLDKVHELI